VYVLAVNVALGARVVAVPAVVPVVVFVLVVVVVVTFPEHTRAIAARVSDPAIPYAGRLFSI
jgi:hypothetical protein